MPQRCSACGACSRDEPQPKLLPTIEHARVAPVRIVERMQARRARAPRAIVFEDVRFEALERDGLQKPRRHDAIGVDVVAAQRRAPGRRRR